MATTISTQDIVDAKRDIEDIGKAVNEKVIVSPRYGEDFKSLPMIAEEFQISSDAAEAAAQSAQNSASLAANSANNANSSANIAEAAATSATISAGVFETPEAGVDPVTGVADGAYFNVRSSNDESYIDEYQNVGGSAVATGKSYPSGNYVETISEYTALPFKQGKSYTLHERVQLESGDIVKSTIDGNTNDPNENPTFWYLDTSNFLKVLLKEGESFAEINYNTLQVAASTGKNIEVNAGSFYVSNPVQLATGQIVTGQGADDFKQSGFTKITNNNENGGVFWYTSDASSGQKQMPQVYNFGLYADYPIRFNNEKTAVIVDGSGSNCPYGMRPYIRCCNIRPRVNGVGIGVSLTKQFDGIVEFNNIRNFSVNFLLFGCDLNIVRDNRILHGGRYNILELSALTFSSQNIITHNDILYIGDDGTYIKTTARHARIFDNYLEHTDGVNRPKFFIDASSADVPADLVSASVNLSGARFTTSIKLNRIDGMHYAKTAVYRYQPQGQTYGEIEDVGTTGASLTAPALLLCDSSGNTVNGVPLHYNQGNFASFSFKGPKFGVWDGFKTDRTQNKSITSKSIAQSASSLYSGLATNYLEVGGDSFFLKPTAAQFCFNVSYCDAIKTPNVLYKISVLARQIKSDSSNTNESLNIGLAKFVSSGVYSNGAFETPQTLSESWQVLNFFVTPAFDSLTNIFAYLLNRSNNTSDVIEIKKITVDNVFSESYSGASTINVPTRKNRGKNIYVSLSDGTNTASSILNYSNGVLYETSKKASATETLDFSATYGNSNIAIVRTGTNSANGTFNVLVED